MLNAPGGVYSSESAWSYDGVEGTGGGQSQFEGEPSYQTAVQQSGRREMPDVAFAASGVPVYDSYDFGATSPWGELGGTSLSVPCWAGLIAIADQLRASQGLTSLDGGTQTLPALYSLPAADFHDITSGNNGYPAGPGYDMDTGLGTPVANLLVPALASYQAPSDLVMTLAQQDTSYYGQPLTIRADVVNPPGSATATGTITFREGSLVLDTVPLDAYGQAVLNYWGLNPGEYTITASYGGDGSLPAGAAIVTADIQPEPTTTTVTASTPTSDINQAVTLTATVTAAPFEPDPDRDGHVPGGSQCGG